MRQFTHKVDRHEVFDSSYGSIDGETWIYNEFARLGKHFHIRERGNTMWLVTDLPLQDNSANACTREMMKYKDKAGLRSASRSPMAVSYETRST